MKHLLWIVAGISLSACFAVSIKSEQTSSGQIVALRLNSELIFPPEQVALYAQDGRVVAANSVDAYYPNCVFELRQRALREVRISPAQFRVERLRLDSGALRKLMHHSTVREVAMGGDSGPSHVEYATEFFLYSAQQSQLYRVTCKHWENPERARHLSTGEIISALGPLFTVITASEQK